MLGIIRTSASDAYGGQSDDKYQKKSKDNFELLSGDLPPRDLKLAAWRDLARSKGVLIDMKKKSAEAIFRRSFQARLTSVRGNLEWLVANTRSDESRELFQELYETILQVKSEVAEDLNEK